MILVSWNLCWQANHEFNMIILYKIMPNKYIDAGRHHIPKMKFKVTNWTSYEAGLRRRGTWRLWVSNDAI
jgi:hypothetical protein